MLMVVRTSARGVVVVTDLGFVCFRENVRNTGIQRIREET
jgi:hypothetical protein